uniref:Leucine rich repeat containing 74B n=1 Tax=Myripristis murdjan TaxID=586833 RepID=A0A667ZDG8_9TELE
LRNRRLHFTGEANFFQHAPSFCKGSIPVLTRLHQDAVIRSQCTLIFTHSCMNPIQSAGCYGVLQSLQANPESAMEMLDFSDIAVNQDFEELRSAVKDILPSLVVKHGRRIGKPKAGGATL